MSGELDSEGKEFRQLKMNFLGVFVGIFSAQSVGISSEQ